MSELVTPRINSSMLNEYMGRKVKLVGKVLKEPKSQSDLAIIQCSDGGQVEAKMIMPLAKMDTYVEIVCSVETLNAVNILAMYNMGDDIDLGKVDKTIVYSHDPRFRQLFEA